jgi:hypothetical protein
VTSYVIARTLGDPTASTSHKSSFTSQPHPNSEPKIPNADTGTDAAQTAVPAAATADSIPIAVLPPQDETPPSGASTKPPTPLRGRVRVPPGTTTTTTSSLPAFFVDGEGSEDDGAARLAGVGVFSPVASMPGSPVVSRRNILEKECSEEDAGSGSEESASSAARGVLRRGGRRARDRGEEAAAAAAAAAAEEEEEEEEEEHGSHERSASDGGGSNGGGGSTSGESSFALLDREESFEDAGAHIRRRVPGTTGADE